MEPKSGIIEKQNWYAEQIDTHPQALICLLIGCEDVISWAVFRAQMFCGQRPTLWKAVINSKAQTTQTEKSWIKEKTRCKMCNNTSSQQRTTAAGTKFNPFSLCLRSELVLLQTEVQQQECVCRASRWIDSGNIKPPPPNPPSPFLSLSPWGHVSSSLSLLVSLVALRFVKVINDGKTKRLMKTSPGKGKTRLPPLHLPS